MESGGEDLLVVYVTAPRAEAEFLARALVDQRVAACVNILNDVRSVYGWEDKVTEDDEALLIVKTTKAGYGALEAKVRELHSYAIPEIVAISLYAAHRPYVDWAAAWISGGGKA